MKLIVGLGNPGIEYQFTPHNIGFLAVDRIAEQCGVTIDNRHCKALTGRSRLGNEEVLLAKPETYMNLSGMSVLELARKYEADAEKDLIVIYDELDLPLGMIRRVYLVLVACFTVAAVLKLHAQGWNADAVKRARRIIGPYLKPKP